jgi:hypothetical protein
MSLLHRHFLYTSIIEIIESSLCHVSHVAKDSIIFLSPIPFNTEIIIVLNVKCNNIYNTKLVKIYHRDNCFEHPSAKTKKRERSVIYWNGQIGHNIFLQK